MSNHCRKCLKKTSPGENSCERCKAKMLLWEQAFNFSKDFIKEKIEQNKKTCVKCGREFLFSGSPILCMDCYAAESQREKEREETERKRRELEVWQGRVNNMRCGKSFIVIKWPRQIVNPLSKMTIKIWDGKGVF